MTCEDARFDLVRVLHSRQTRRSTRMRRTEAETRDAQALIREVAEAFRVSNGRYPTIEEMTDLGERVLAALEVESLPRNAR